MKTTPTIIDHFTESAKSYDEKNQQLSAIADNMHFLIGLILKDLPINARILCVGVGTGAEIIYLSKIFPHWTFVGVDPSSGMLDVCRDRLHEAGILNRCELINGYIYDVQSGQNFDAVLSILVAHFIKLDERLGFYQAMYDRLRNNGILINTEISYDLNSAEFPLMLKNWEPIQLLMGATPESIINLSNVLRNMLCIISTKDTEDLLKQTGINIPVRFFQAFMISGWYGIKNAV